MAKATTKTTSPIDYTLGITREVETKSFIDDGLRQYSAHSNVRGIPFMPDGMKQAQRKAMYGVLLRGENEKPDTVERLAARCCSDTDYHHGAGSMEGTIVCLAQNFPGSNNVNLIEPFGQFGSRLSRRPASSRYIKAKLSPNFRKLFRKEDDLITEHHYSNGDKIEPKYFIPLLPISLINGAEGMGTGHATYIMGYNPKDIQAAISQVLKGKKLTRGKLVPWYDGFKGTIERDPITNQITTTGVYETIPGKRGAMSIRIIELPIGSENDRYEAHLHGLMENKVNKKNVVIRPAIVSDFENSSEETGWDILINLAKSSAEMDDAEIIRTFKLITRETENLTLWNTLGELQRYDYVEDIIEEFVEWRLEKYEVRRQALIGVVEAEILKIDERIRFINFYLSHTDTFRSLKKAELMDLLAKNEFTTVDALLSMPIWNLTRERIEALEAELLKEIKKLEDLNATTADRMYGKELQEIKL